MVQVRTLNNRVLIRNIDLKKDKLTVHGTEIEESKLKRLHDSLTLGIRQGHIYVNCDGACYFQVLGKLFKPIHKVIFDWSPFDVVVPNSVNKSLRQELKEKVNEIDTLNRQLLSTIASYEEAKNEAKELKEQVLEHVKTQKDKEMELKMVNEQLSLVDFELVSNKIELESSKKAVLDLQDQLSTCKNECQDMKNEFQNQLSLNMKANEEFVIKLKDSQQETSTLKSELNSTKTQLDELQDQLSLTKDQLESTKVLLESSKKEVQELKNQSCLYKEEEPHQMSDKVRKLSDDLNSINSEVKSGNQKLEQVLISMLWNELDLDHQSQLRLLQPSLMGKDEGQNMGNIVPNIGCLNRIARLITESPHRPIQQPNPEARPEGEGEADPPDRTLDL
ncbi:hypothetical protein RND81_09G015400 [Saponaria officinalis]|uniref:Uncharacterized protein n=1 Tax=Saponaria officinalis TaxID=3572 RepID=A0AAW1IGZ5_SAPOF